jgi:hypothetical protein
VILFLLNFAKDWPKIWFVTIHYFLNALVFGAAFYFYYKMFGHYSAFTAMAIAMVSLFIIEFVFFRFFYKGELWFLNFWDWILPAFIVATTVYFVTRLVR